MLRAIDRRTVARAKQRSDPLKSPWYSLESRARTLLLRTLLLTARDMTHPRHLRAGTPTEIARTAVATRIAAFSLRITTQRPQQTMVPPRAVAKSPPALTPKPLSPFHGNPSTHTHCRHHLSKRRLLMEVKLLQDHSRTTSRTTSSKKEHGPLPRRRSCWRLFEACRARTGMLLRRWFLEETRSNVCKNGKPTWTLRSTDCPGPMPKTRSWSKPTTDTETRGNRLPRWLKPAPGTNATTVSVLRASRPRFSKLQGLIQRVLRMGVFLVAHAQKDPSLAQSETAKRGKGMDLRVA